MKKLLLTLLLFATYAFAFSAVQVNYLYIRNASCDSSGVIAVYGSDGNGTYSYRWSTGSTAIGPADSITGLHAGDYSVTCYSGADSAKRNFHLYAFGVDTVYRGHACYGGLGWISAGSISAVTWPMHTQWYLNGDSLAHDVYELDSLHKGLYSYYMVDSNGCEASGSVKIGESSPVFNVYTNDTVVCYNEWGTIWYTPGFTLLQSEGYFYGSSNDTSYPFNTLNNGFDFAVCAMDSEGCVVCDDTLPAIYVAGHPYNLTIYHTGDTISAGSINLAYDSIHTYAWGTPGDYYITHYNYFVVDTPGNYFVAKQYLGCATGTGNINVTTVSVDDMASDGMYIQLSPNPTTSETLITVQSKDIGKTMQLYDLYGRLLTENIIQQSITALQLHQYPAGSYLVKIGEHA
ncbi:MAG TPA: T9SS type A sorting domain-containing protein, partial [Chitinophagales bacterium]|nr:T9SS type A sorting domain-containing protein [Chitinophagales bacterium]